MNIALIGPSGVGKGTHAQELVDRFDLLHISTGDLFRENLEKQTALGLVARRYMDEGELVPDEVVDAMIEEWLRKTPSEKGILFDGFPRTKYQANFLDDLFHDIGRILHGVIYLKVSDDEIIKRLSNRLICRECQTPFNEEYNPFESCPYDKCNGEYLYRRPDDAIETAGVRLKVFHRVTEPMIEYYQGTGKLIIVDGEGDIDQVQVKLIEVVQAVDRQESRAATVAEMDQVKALKEDVTTLSPEEATHTSLDIVLLGGPGSGKGTQAEQLSKELELQHIATGDLFRENLKNETELGKLAKTFMDRGELVPDDVTEAMVEERISRPDAQPGFILDGFPRTLPQAEALTQMMTDLNRRLDGALYIKVSDDEIVRRLSGRLICRNCQTPYHKIFNPPEKEGVCDLCGGELYQRDDDNPETVRARLNTFHKQTAPVIGYYRGAGLLIEIEGEGEVSEVTNRILTAARNLR